MQKFLRFFWAVALIPSAFSCNQSGSSIDNQGVRIAYTDTKKGDTTLVFVHGWCLNKTYWTGQVAAFQNKYRVITVDLPGFGESGTNRSDWSTAAFGGDIDALLSKLDLKNVILIGHSMAGDIVLEAALHAKDRVIGIVGVDNFKNIHPETEQQKADDARFNVLLKRSFTETAFQFFKSDLFYSTTPDSIRKRVLTDVANADTVVATACMAQPAYDETGNLKAYGKTLYLVNSDYIPTDTAAFVSAQIPYKILYVMDVGHFPMLENPSAFNGRLGETLLAVGTAKR